MAMTPSRSSYDVIVVGGGAAGLSTAALLASEGRSVLVIERSPYLGGRGMAIEDSGYQLNLGAHLMEDSGSGLTKIMEHVGKKLVHGPRNTDMPVWNHETETWGSIRDRYSGDKTELKKVIEALKNTTWDELEAWDDRPMREWILQHTDHQGVIDLFEFITVLECMTETWEDHSASDNLWVRKMHYEEMNTAAYSFWPEGGWDAMFEDLRDAIVEHGGEVLTGTSVSRVLVEDGRVRGVTLPRPSELPNAIFEDDLVEASCVVSTLPVWNVLQVVDRAVLPDWYVDQILMLAQDKWRITWAGLYLGTDESVEIIDRRELATFLHTPRARCSGYMFEMTAMDPSVAPEGNHLYVTGAMLPGSKGKDRVYLKKKFDEFEQDVLQMWPKFDGHINFRKRHLVHDPSFGVIQKPGLVGRYRPHWRAPNVDGLFFASETFRSRGIGVDRAARAGLTVAEDILGARIPGFEDTWRY